MPLKEQDRAKLDSIVQQMTDNNEPEDNIRFVVEDFKKKYDPQAAPKAPEQPGFFERAKEGLVGPFKAVAEGYAASKASNPYAKALEATVVNPMMGVAQRFTEDKQPNRIAAAANAVFGAPIEAIGNDIKERNYSGALGTAASNILLLGMPAILKQGGKLAKTAASATKSAVINTAEELATSPQSKLAAPGMARAVEYAEKKGIPVTRGELTGSELLQKVERTAVNTPGAAEMASDFFLERNAKVKAEGAKMKRQAGKAATMEPSPGIQVADPTGAGEAVAGRFTGRAADLKKISDRQYDSVRQLTERGRLARQAEIDSNFASEAAEAQEYNAARTAEFEAKRQRVMQSGGDPNTVPPPELRSIPKPSETQAAPIAMAPIKESLKPALKELEGVLTETEKASNPGYSRIKAIVNGEDEFRSALDIDKDLSVMKRLLRKESEGYAATTSGRYLSKTINALEGQMLEAIEREGGAAAVAALKRGRLATKEMHESLGALDDVLKPGESPAKLYSDLIASGDRNINKLLEIKQRAPKAVETVGATALEQVLSRVSGEGSVADMTTAQNAWKRIGPRTKQELYGPKLTAELTEFFENAPQLVRNINKSGSGGFMQAAKLLGSGGAAVGWLLGSPVEGALVGAGIAGAEMASANAISKLLFQPGGAKLLMEPLKTPPKSPFFKKAVDRLSKELAATNASDQAARISQGAIGQTQQ